MDEELLAAIYARPWDDAPRLVYADRLCERGDEHGELIQLQLAPALDVARRAREAELHERARTHLRSPLSAVLHEAVYRRGFIAEAQVAWHAAREVSALGAHPAWATVERLTFLSFGRGDQPARARLMQHLPPTLRSLRHLEQLDDSGVHNLCDAPEPWPIVELSTSARGEASIELLQRTALLPSLSIFEATAPDPLWVTAAGFWPRLTSLRLALEEIAALWEWRLRARAQPRLETLVVEHQGMVYELSQPGMTQLAVRAAPYYGLRLGDVAAALEGAPVDAFTSVRVEAGEAIDDADRRRVVEAAQRQERLETLAFEV
jgi:uncharacterized protein (TIGR02996 family)